MVIRSGRNRQGATLVLVAVCLVALTAVGAVVIDLGMLLKARSDAQRAAEAAALAGASAFVEFPAGDARATDSAEVRARRFAEANAILNRPVTPTEVQPPQIIVDSQKVRVVVRRPQVGTWFARLLGADVVPISASAAAMAMYAGTGNCVRPFAVPDAWEETGDDPNNNHLEDGTETWTYNDDPYTAGNPDAPNNRQTGYGSELRNSNGDYTNDYGRELALSLPDPISVTPYQGPQQFLPFVPSGGNDPSDYLDAIEKCDPSQVKLGEEYQLMTNPQFPGEETKRLVDSLVNTDPAAHWDSQSETIEGSDYADWRTSPRAVRIALFDPRYLGQRDVVFNNLGLMFLEGFDQPTNQLPGRTTNQLRGRLFYFATGRGDPDEGMGTLVKGVRLVE